MTRQELVAEARSWIGTKYVHGARVKGGGVDCASFIAEVLIAAGLADREDLGVYSHDWFHHSQDEKYMLRLVRHAPLTLEAVAYRSLAVKPGNIVLTKAARSKLYNHGGVITGWPLVVHATLPEVAEVDASRDPMWAFQQIAIFDPFAKS
jgi:cell wall-associated NlpC family hydrolase